MSDKYLPPVVSEEEPEDDGPHVPVTLWEAIQEPKIAAGIETVLAAAARYIDEHAKNEPKRVRLAIWAMVSSYVFGLLIFAGIGFLGWHGILSHETTAAILSALIGYWYGQKEKEKKH